MSTESDLRLAAALAEERPGDSILSEESVDSRERLTAELRRSGGAGVICRDELAQLILDAIAATGR
jgi:hypothetical protein